MKLIFKSFCCAVIISCLLSLTGFCGACEDIGSRVFRLHIIANSDSEHDQQLKLLVRDEITAYTDSLFAKCKNKEEAMSAAAGHKEEIIAKSEAVLRSHGSSDKVDAYVTKMRFDTRVYKDFTLPAGEYDALRIVIGEGQGHNWWCVLFPAVCVPSASSSIDDALSGEENEIVHESDHYEIRFKAVEIFQSLLGLFGG